MTVFRSLIGFKAWTFSNYIENPGKKRKMNHIAKKATVTAIGLLLGTYMYAMVIGNAANSTIVSSPDYEALKVETRSKKENFAENESQKEEEITTLEKGLTESDSLDEDELSAEEESTVEADYEEEEQEEEDEETDSERIERVCQKYKSSLVEEPSKLSYHHFHVDNRNKLLYCFIPKTASSLWKAINAIMTGKTSETNASKINNYTVHFVIKPELLPHYPAKTQETLLESYFKFTVVRHPFYRLVSGYRDKLNPGKDWFRKTYGTKIIRKYRPKATVKEIRSGTPTFSEFVDYLTDPKTVAAPKRVDDHWTQYHRLCHPCNVKFNYILRFESLKEDTDHLLSSRNLSDLVTYTFIAPASNTKKVNRYIRQLKIGKLLQLYKVFEFDFELFGYDFDIKEYLT
ncbi:carbohydrate sulfotransferase 11-like isoform X2 [Artemia franciscana]|uniref:carbohydrate sulfotransferase 11-like isoform X2 n=2 Tax=Artemia franciscana TaxID=6661 RepID=UPI0032DB8D14